MASSELISDRNYDKKFYGIYRGIVVDPNDPLKANRLKVQVPQITGSSITDWAVPCRRPDFINHEGANGAHARIVNSETTDTSVVIAGGANPTKVTFDTDDGVNGIYINPSASSQIKVAKPGTYYFGVTLQVYYAGAGSDQTFVSWFSKTGTNIVGSTKRATVKGSGHYYNFLLATTQEMTTEDYIEVNCIGTDANFQLAYVAGGASPTRPSAYKSVLNAFCIAGDLPAVGDGVWVMYEGGDPNFPVWMGVF